MNTSKLLLLWLAAVASTAVLVGCATSSLGRPERQVGESVVFIGEEPAALAYVPIRGHRLVVRSTYRPAPNSIRFIEGQDFVVDWTAGTLRRTPGSRLPDFRKNMLFGQQKFDHSKYPGFGNAGFFAFVDYSSVFPAAWPVQARQTQFLPSTQAKLKSGQIVKVVAFGDSITAGGDASESELIYWRRWVDKLQRKYPRASLKVINGATGGDSTAQGLERLQTKVLDEKPDLVLIGFGMNDHNVNGVPVPTFEHNLRQIITRIRHGTGAELVLLSAFPPNPEWEFGSHHMQDYADATCRVASETTCAYADVFNNWQAVAARKKPEDLLGNNINHPNDFGHWIYFRVLEALGL